MFAFERILELEIRTQLIPGKCSSCSLINELAFEIALIFQIHI